MTMDPVKTLTYLQRFTAPQRLKAHALKCPTCGAEPKKRCVFLVNVRYRGQYMDEGSFHVARYPTTLEA